MWMRYAEAEQRQREKAALLELEKQRMKQHTTPPGESRAITEERKMKFDEEIRLLSAYADNAYVAYLRKLRTTECLGEDIKMVKGIFGKVELEAHKKAAEHYGYYKAMVDIINLLTIRRKQSDN